MVSSFGPSLGPVFSTQELANGSSKKSVYATNQPKFVWANSAQTIQTSLLQLSDNATGIDGPLDERGNIIVNMISYKVIGIQDVRGPKGFIWDRTARTAKVAKKTCPRYFLCLENDFENFIFTPP